MIGYLSGRIFHKGLRTVILLTNQQVGYEIYLSSRDLEKTRLDETADFFIHTNVKEDALELYGFKTKEHLDFFRQLLSVSGIGPKSALNVMSLTELNDLKKAITSGDPTLLQQVSGIGKKTAERLVVELKEKIITDLSSQNLLLPEQSQVIAALISLGYKERQVREVLNNIELTGDLSAKVKQALQIINQSSRVD